MYIGKFVGISPQHIIIQAESGSSFTLETLPALGDDVLDKTNTTVGKISDIFGPVERPLFSVKPLQTIQLSNYTSSLGDSFYSVKPKITAKNTKNRRNKREGYSESRNTKQFTTRSRGNYKRNTKGTKNE